MNRRRTTLLVGLPVLLALLFLGPVGVVEATLWCALVGVWLWAFVWWAGRPPRPAGTAAGGPGRG